MEFAQFTKTVICLDRELGNQATPVIVSIIEYAGLSGMQLLAEALGSPQYDAGSILCVMCRAMLLMSKTMGKAQFRMWMPWGSIYSKLQLID